MNKNNVFYALSDWRVCQSNFTIVWFCLTTKYSIGVLWPFISIRFIVTLLSVNTMQFSDMTSLLRTYNKDTNLLSLSEPIKWFTCVIIVWLSLYNILDRFICKSLMHSVLIRQTYTQTQSVYIRFPSLLDHWNTSCCLFASLLLRYYIS